MDSGILEKALKMLEKRPLCDHCLGRQFALLGHGVENDARGKAIKLALTLEAHALALSKTEEGIKALKILATNGFFETAKEILHKMKRRVPEKNLLKTCFLCENKFETTDDLAKRALKQLEDYEYNNFLVGVELPLFIEEREDEFRAEFGVGYAESMRTEFGRILGKKIALYSEKAVEHKKPEVVVLVDPFTNKIGLQVNPLFISGRYKKLARGIPQSKWFCSNCRGKGCEKCNWTGKMYQESVEEIIGKLFLDATGGAKTSFHASGREDIDARMLGKGRPFVIEISKPKKRFLDLKKLENDVNAYARGKVEVSNLKFSNKDAVRKLKKAESTQKEYRVIVEFENEITKEDMQLLEDKLTNSIIKQKTPTRVLHRRADLTREKYIYDVKVKVLSPKKVEMKIRCQGGLYVKELVTGDDGRTTPSVSELLKNRAKPIKLDVLNVVIKD
ncbi:MAG: tRNA pseudouridine(54/55) synthase Pus10 [Candidatus Bathyarchaeota archaeon]|nr:tRNA pseudouridine(54/55) synthase Pus10 [Candidatus Bathyarchaeota archaeon]